MAGSIIAMPANGDSDWSSFVTIVEKTIRGYIGLDVSNIGATTVPAIRDGSVIEVNGTIYQFTTAETITGWPSAGGTTLYMTIVPAGTVCTATFTASAPTWTGTKNGWYDGNDRYFGELTWGGSATYTDKIIYQRVNDNNDNIYVTGRGGIKGDDATLNAAGLDLSAGTITATGGINTSNVTLKTKLFELGEWNMSATALITKASGIAFANMRRVSAIVRDDSGSNWWDIKYGTNGSPYNFGNVNFTGTNITVNRYSGGFFDSATFNGTVSTVPNRGYIVLDHV